MAKSYLVLALFFIVLILSGVFAYYLYESDFFYNLSDDGDNNILPNAKRIAVKNITKPPVDIEELEFRVHSLINEERLKQGLAELEWNDEVAASAREHSEYLAGLNRGFVKELYIAHEGPDGKLHSDRLREDNVFYFNTSGENIHANSLVKSYYIDENLTPASYHTMEELSVIAVKGWMNSTGHRKNILTTSFDETGVGIARDSTETNYVFTQVFITRATCGYETGSCCREPGYLPFCYVPLECEKGVCG